MISDFCDNNKNSASECQRDPKYYHSDGSIIFLVDGVLFKLQASLIFGSRIGHDCPAATVDPFNRPTPMYLEDITSGASDSSDPSPITLAKVTVRQFRHYLLLIFGLPTDKEYTKTVTGPLHPSRYTSDLCIRYLDTSCLAYRFGRTDIEEWAINMLYDSLTKSMHNLTLGAWDKDTLKQLRLFTRGKKPELPSVTFIQYFISVSVNEAALAEGNIIAASNHETCVQLYKDPKLPIEDPALFGCVFASILSLGNRSSTWTTKLAGKMRAILYNAQVEFVNLSAQFQSLHWLVQPEAPSALPAFETICSCCRRRFLTLWSESFGKCGNLGSSVLLRDISSLAQLPQRRLSLVHKWEDDRAPVITLPPPQSNTWFRKADPPLVCEQGRCSLDDILLNIDDRIQQVFEEITTHYRRFFAALEEDTDN
ncbi:hypothetical protein CTheo_4944 [Ceratobasidium theobromae]|uniref:BTB domain-containing protein n=1 Tax=Ceratobasidium theobromae TaxID=1582974 RepID=A0A5N5QJG1_9AGAM|nr:hypothetical protein CTheo_4944 [Ceratobasidium theobromae]